MHNARMLRATAALLLVLLAPLSIADELLTPADYLKLMEESKLRYNLMSEPSKNPIEEMTCPRRDESLRVVKEGEKTSLVTWSVAPDATKLLEEGETLYQAEQMKEAAAKYKAAIDADPQAATAYYFYGDALLFGSNDAAAALEQYKKGIALDPTVPAGHFFAATAYTRLGRMSEAREEIVQALSLYPGYEAVWRAGTQNPDYWDIQPMTRHPFEPPAGYLGKKTDKGIDISLGEKAEWMGYAMCKAVWAYEPKFRREGEAQGEGWSLEAEGACVLNHLMATINQTQAALEERKKSQVSVEEAMAALPPREKHIHEVAKENLLDGYVLFEIIGRRCPLAMSILPDEARSELKAYIRKYIIVAKK